MMGRVEALVDEDMRRDCLKGARGLVALALLLHGDRCWKLRIAVQEICPATLLTERPGFSISVRRRGGLACVQEALVDEDMRE